MENVDRKPTFFMVTGVKPVKWRIERNNMTDAVEAIQNFIEFIDNNYDYDDERMQDIRTTLVEVKLEEEEREQW